jgi:hypothetical protein
LTASSWSGKDLGFLRAAAPNIFFPLIIYNTGGRMLSIVDSIQLRPIV